MFVRDAIQNTVSDYDLKKRWYKTIFEPAIIKSLKALLVKIENELTVIDFNQGSQLANESQLNEKLWAELLNYFIEFKKTSENIDLTTNTLTSVELVSM